jgi:hypothetical protein
MKIRLSSADLDTGGDVAPEKAHYAAIAALGCIVCYRNGQSGTPAEVHHLRAYTGAGKKAHYLDTIPLCAPHHRLADGSSRWDGELAYHCAPRTWEARYGMQRELLAQVTALLDGVKKTHSHVNKSHKAKKAASEGG